MSICTAASNLRLIIDLDWHGAQTTRRELRKRPHKRSPTPCWASRRRARRRCACQRMPPCRTCTRTHTTHTSAHTHMHTHAHTRTHTHARCNPLQNTRAHEPARTRTHALSYTRAHTIHHATCTTPPAPATSVCGGTRTPRSASRRSSSRRPRWSPTSARSSSGR